MEKEPLFETITPDRKPLIYEDREEAGKKFLYLKGLFLEGEVQNHNGRKYPRSEIEKAVQQMMERIQKHGPQAGELDHPEGLNINFDRVSHAITDITMEGNNGVGTMRVLNAGMGLIIKASVEAGINVGVSSRGSGNINGMGDVEDFDIVTIDAVINPSAPSAYPKASFAESLLANPHGREACYLTECIVEDEAAQKYLQQEIKKFLTDIRDSVSWRK